MGLLATLFATLSGGVNIDALAGRRQFYGLAKLCGCM
jgi:hypothetical protein